MKSNANEIVKYIVDLEDFPPLTEAQIAEIKKLAEMPDIEIDTSDIPGLTEEQ